MQSRISSLHIVLLVAVAVSSAVVGFGQGCGQMRTTSGQSERMKSNPGQDGSADFSSNGGGYGGYRTDELGAYSNNLTIASGNGSTLDSSYLRFTGLDVCGTSTLPPVLRRVAGRIYYDGSYFQYRSDFCSPEMRVATDQISYVHFNFEVMVYGGHIYLYYEKAPVEDADIRTAVAHCRSQDVDHGSRPGVTQTGRTINIFKQGGKLFAESYYGEDAGGGLFVRSRAQAFEVMEMPSFLTIFGGTPSYRFLASEFSLLMTVNQDGTAKGSLSSGFLSLTNEPYSCWAERSEL